MVSVEKSFRRTPKNYDGSAVTTHRVSDLLPRTLSRLSGVYQNQPQLILAAWAALIGPQLAPMAQAVGFSEGVLQVKVSNSPLYSLLSQQERPRLLAQLRAQFPQVAIKNITFRIG